MLPDIGDANKLNTKLNKLNHDLLASVFLVGFTLSAVDVAFYVALHPVVVSSKGPRVHAPTHAIPPPSTKIVHPCFVCVFSCPLCVCVCHLVRSLLFVRTICACVCAWVRGCVCVVFCLLLQQSWKDNQRAQFLNVCRWFDFVQHQDAVKAAVAAVGLPAFTPITISKNLAALQQQTPAEVRT